MTGARVRLPLAVLAVLVVQTSLLPAVNIDDVRPDALLLFAIAGGVVAGAEGGALIGFGVGMVADLFVQTPLGLSALTFSLVGFIVGSLQAGMIRASWWITPITALFASAAGVVLFAVIGAVVGQSQLVTPRLAEIAGLVAVMNAVLALPTVALVRWALPRRASAERAYAR